MPILRAKLNLPADTDGDTDTDCYAVFFTIII